MQVILSHINLDFDGLASMVAAKKLFPKAKLVLPTKQGKSVERFLALYRDSFNLYYPNQIHWGNVTEVILVDIGSLQRVGEVSNLIQKENVEFIVYDHHQANEANVKAKFAVIEQVGATITLLIEEIKAKKLPVSSFEATIFALGLYTDTGSFTYLNTTSRDLLAGSFLLQSGANLEIISKFSEPPLQEEEQQLLHSLIQQSEEHYFDGVDILVAHHQQKDYTGGLALLARKALEMTGTDALFFVVEMGKRTFIVGRSTSERIDVLPIIKLFSGGGHPKAASAMVKNGNFEEIVATVRSHIETAIKPSLTAKDIMSSPVKVISTVTSIEEAGKMMLRYGHTGFPVLEDGNLLGIISRRDVDKAKHHGLGHAPVKAYMSTDPTTIHSDMSLEEVQNLMISKNVGRLPVIEKGTIVGIISRTNVIEALHGEKIKSGHIVQQSNPLKLSLARRMKTLLSDDILRLLRTIGEHADKQNYRAFMIGGVVRDLVIGRENEDIDIVVEGDGIAFAKQLTDIIGGTVRTHEKFGTATWKHPLGLKIDITSARTEYYDYPAALPNVEMSSLREDLFRRDFTINAMALQINTHDFGKLIDFFHGYQDIRQKKIRILYNLSFVEDPTRILRAVRFEQRFGFEMDKQTFELAQISVDKIASTSKIRLAHELHILLSENHPVEALKRLGELGVLHYLHGSSKNYDNTLKLLGVLKNHYDDINKTLPKQSDRAWISYLIILFHEQKEHLQLLQEYALSSDDLGIIKEMSYLLSEDVSISAEPTLGELHAQFRNFSYDAILCLIILKNYPSDLQALVKRYLLKRVDIPKLLSGDDLKVVNIPPGPLYSKILLELECLYLNQEITSRDEALAFVKSSYLGQ